MVVEYNYIAKVFFKQVQKWKETSNGRRCLTDEYKSMMDIPGIITEKELEVAQKDTVEKMKEVFDLMREVQCEQFRKQVGKLEVIKSSVERQVKGLELKIEENRRQMEQKLDMILDRLNKTPQ